MRPITITAAVRRASLAIVAATCLGACRGPHGHLDPGGPPDQTLRIGGVVASGFDVGVDPGGPDISGPTDLSQFELAIGRTFYAEREEGLPRKKGRGEALFGVAEYDGLDAFQVGGGGMVFLGDHPFVSPFLSGYGVFDFFETRNGNGFGAQIGARLGAGVEVALSDRGFVQVGVDYTVPFLPAESDTTPSYETEVEGWAVRVSVGVQF